MSLLKTNNNWSLYQKDDQKSIRKPIDFNPDIHVLFDTCPFKAEIFNNQEVYLIWYGGSYASGLNDEFSDVDIIVLVKERKPQPRLFIEYKNLRIHGYCYTIDNFLERNSIHEIVGMCKNFFLTENTILGKNPKYPDIIKGFLQPSVQQNIINTGIVLLADRMSSGVDNFILNHKMLIERGEGPFKITGTLLEISSYIEYNNPNLEQDFIKKIRRPTIRKITTKDEERLVDKLKHYKIIIQTFLEQEDHDILYLKQQGLEKIKDLQ